MEIGFSSKIFVSIFLIIADAVFSGEFKNKHISSLLRGANAIKVANMQFSLVTSLTAKSLLIGGEEI